MFVRLQAISGVQRHPDKIRNRHSVKKIRRLNRIILKHTDPVARLQAHGQQRIGEPNSALPGFTEC